jgi:hypothetical protein
MSLAEHPSPGMIEDHLSSDDAGELGSAEECAHWNLMSMMEQLGFNVATQSGASSPPRPKSKVR